MCRCSVTFFVCALLISCGDDSGAEPIDGSQPSAGSGAESGAQAGAAGMLGLDGDAAGADGVLDDAGVTMSDANTACGVPTADDECTDNASCGDGQRCACNALGGHSCVGAECFEDADCGEGQACRRNVVCDLPFGSYYCSSEQDECQSSEECGTGVCHHSHALGHFICEVVPPCTT